MSMSALLVAGLLWTAEVALTAPPPSGTTPATHDARVVVPGIGPVPVALDFGFPLIGNDKDKQVFSFWIGFFR